MKSLPRSAIVWLAPLASVISQTTWYVDASAAPGGNGSAAAPFVAIQAALAAATSGDSVSVAPGSYGPIDFGGKNLAVASQAGAASTIIQGQGTFSVVRFVNGETAAAILDGFTITGGQATGTAGGGIQIAGASPSIRNCVIIGNHGGNGSSGGSPGAAGSAGGAGGILVASGSPSISGCRIAGNAGGFGGMGFGGYFTGNGPPIPGGSGGRGGAGGIHVLAGTATITDCRVESNTGGVGGYGGHELFGGFGEYAPGGPPGTGGTGGIDAAAPASATVGFSSFSANTGGTSGNSQVFGGAGGASGTLFLRVCVIEANHGGPEGVGGVDIVNGLIEGCLVSRNHAGPPQFLGIFYGIVAGVYVRSTPVVNSVIAGNVSPSGTGGLRAYSSRVLGCTIFGNIQGGTPGKGGIEFQGAPQPLAGDTLVDTIVWGNVGGQVSAPASFGTYASYCDVQGGLPGIGNNQADPLLADPANGDFHLLPGSPCIDAGNANVAGLPLVDVEGDPRVFHGAIDIGADESILLLRLTQPGGPGTPVTITNDNLDAGHEYYNVFSLELCNPIGSGPLLGLCATDIGFLSLQFHLPLGAEPIHVLAPASLVHWGPYPIPPITLEGICFEWLPSGFGPVSAVTRFTVQ